MGAENGRWGGGELSKGQALKTGGKGLEILHPGTTGGGGANQGACSNQFRKKDKGERTGGLSE